MNIETNEAAWLQDLLLGLTDADLSCIDFAYGKIDGSPPGTDKRWQLGVDTICRLTISKLLRVNERASIDRSIPVIQEKIRSANPYVDHGGMDWIAKYFDATESLYELLLKYFPVDEQGIPELRPAFIEALETIFKLNGVPWSDAPLLPIKPDEASIASKANIRYPVRRGPPDLGTVIVRIENGIASVQFKYTN